MYRFMCVTIVQASEAVVMFRLIEDPGPTLEAVEAIAKEYGVTVEVRMRRT